MSLVDCLLVINSHEYHKTERLKRWMHSSSEEWQLAEDLLEERGRVLESPLPGSLDEASRRQIQAIDNRYEAAGRGGQVKLAIRS